MLAAKTTSKIKQIQKWFFIVLGALLVSVALEYFFVPNSLIDGGVIGIAIMVAHITGLPFALFLIVLNLPFLVIGYTQIGKTFVITTLISVILMSIGTTLMHGVEAFVKDPLLAAIFGGIIIGIGVGLIIKYGGSTDGVEISAIIINKKFSFSVGQIVMFLNIFIFIISGFVFGWISALYSMIAYFIAFKAIDATAEGLDESRTAWVISDKANEIGETIQARLGRSVTYIDGKGSYSQDNKNIIFCSFTRLEEAKFKLIIEEKDPAAFFTIGHVHEVQGGSFKKRDIH